MEIDYSSAEEVAMGTPGGPLVQGVGLLSWSDLLQLFNFKETAFLSVKAEWSRVKALREVSLKDKNIGLICFLQSCPKGKGWPTLSSCSHCGDGSGFFCCCQAVYRTQDSLVSVFSVPDMT